MEINKELIEKVAKNAQLKLTEEEKEEFIPQFREILKYFSEIDSANVHNLHPTFQPIKITNVFREDSPKKSLTQEEALKNTKHKKDGFFLGPKTF
ncbi:MAG: Asp-tRNA(Asn)/Glu-tRNA(Gln) amidotransferase subunit GatC [Candidatus Woesearchaeota archaeon]